jgi:hypothetical protein
MNHTFKQLLQIEMARLEALFPEQKEVTNDTQSVTALSK